MRPLRNAICVKSSNYQASCGRLIYPVCAGGVCNLRTMKRTVPAAVLCVGACTGTLIHTGARAHAHAYARTTHSCTDSA